MNENFKIKQNWTEIGENKYDLLGLQGTENIVCLSSYVVKHEADANIISFINYIGYNEDFLNELDKSLQEMNEINDIIDGNKNDKDYQNSSLINNIYHGFTTINNIDLYINVNQVLVTEGKYGYSFQVFTKAKNGLLCAQATIKELNKENILESIFKLLC